jgi:glycosyltransferase involved in cell wall biosynthesis
MAAGTPLRLLMMTDTAILGPGGSERFLRNLLGRLPSQRYAIDVLQLAPPPPAAQQVAQLDNAGVRLLHQPIDAIYAPRGLAAFRKVRERVARGDYDIVQSHHEKSDLICAFLPRTRGVRRISNRRDMGFQKTRRVRSVFRHANARFDRIVAPSRSILDALVKDENANRARCLAIPNGVDTQRFRPADAAQRERLRAALGFGAGECLIGCVASFTPVKRHDTLIDAFARVRREHAQARLLLVGAGPLRSDIEARIGAAGLDGAVQLRGARAHVENVLPALDLFALSSSTEGLSNAILEAQACGLPVVATDVGGNVDLVQPPGTGILVPPVQADAFAQGLAELIREPERRRACGAAARSRIEREYSLAAMSAAYERLYEELANEC